MQSKASAFAISTRYWVVLATLRETHPIEVTWVRRQPAVACILETP
ncbi:MAG: hypothetical protein H0V97_04125 [Actinobacteria bacterium]|nr:hypothetical protein [Actinomycetota bacterium]